MYVTWVQVLKVSLGLAMKSILEDGMYHTFQFDDLNAFTCQYSSVEITEGKTHFSSSIDIERHINLLRLRG